MKRISFLLLLSVVVLQLQAQHQELTEKPLLWKLKQQSSGDTNSLLDAFRRGQMHGHFRYFFMRTGNREGLTDYHANAIGGGIKFETASFKGFHLGVSGFFVFNIGSSDLAKPDAKTGAANRYEIGLFDIEDPSNKKDIDRLEELYLKYAWKNSSVVFGKQLINTPFINLQDGRMRPTEAGGLYADINATKKLRIEAGYLYELSPRSTVKWYKADESIGVYPQGVNSSGAKSTYAGNLESKGVFIAGLTWKTSDHLLLKVHDLFAENIFNSLLLQADYRYPLADSSRLVAGLQFIHQTAVNNGGNADPAKTYFGRGSQSNTISAMLGWESNHWHSSINYTRITADGRYLMPREWGREPFFTFLPRERNEGLGDVHAYVAKLGYDWLKARVKLSAAFGYYDLPAVTNYRLNKYGMPSYTQFNTDIRYRFAGFLRGLEAQLLYVYKGRSGSNFGNDRYVINKTEMGQWNVLLNFHF
ncbi:MAG: OprD family outer membrane porin [Chitinophagaceae bacterium]|nr:OprD family outer membrane porin [Chitinophagaceae bacterium]